MRYSLTAVDLCVVLSLLSAVDVCVVLSLLTAVYVCVILFIIFKWQIVLHTDVCNNYVTKYENLHKNV